MAQAAATAPAPSTDGLQTPHGGVLINLQAPPISYSLLLKEATKTIEASDRNACDIELLSVGAFSPLTGFLNKDEYESVVNDMRLKNGLLFGIPVGESPLAWSDGQRLCSVLANPATHSLSSLSYHYILTFLTFLLLLHFLSQSSTLIVRILLWATRSL